MELLIKNDESIFDDNPEISQYELNKLMVHRLLTLKTIMKNFQRYSSFK